MERFRTITRRRLRVDFYVACFVALPLLGALARTKKCTSLGVVESNKAIITNLCSPKEWALNGSGQVQVRAYDTLRSASASLNIRMYVVVNEQCSGSLPRPVDFDSLPPALNKNCKTGGNKSICDVKLDVTSIVIKRACVVVKCLNSENKICKVNTTIKMIDSLPTNRNTKKLRKEDDQKINGNSSLGGSSTWFGVPTSIIAISAVLTVFLMLIVVRARRKAPTNAEVKLKNDALAPVECIAETNDGEPEASTMMYDESSARLDGSGFEIEAFRFVHPMACSLYSRVQSLGMSRNRTNGYLSSLSQHANGATHKNGSGRLTASPACERCHSI